MIPFIARFIENVSEIMQIPDTSMIGCTGGNFSQRHDLMRVSLHRILKPLQLPVLYQRSIDADMRNTYPWITLYGFKEACYGLANFHLLLH